MPLTHATVVYDEAGSLARRFWAKVDRSGACWLWTAARNDRGYGVFNTGNGIRAAHTVSWIMEHGEPEDGFEVGHTCHDADLSCLGRATCQHRACVNPAHLKLMTHQENCQQGERGREKTVCRKGLHPMEGVNLMVMSRGTRECRACRRERQREYDRRRFGVSPENYRVSTLTGTGVC